MGCHSDGPDQCIDSALNWKVFGASQEEMVEHLEQGDVAETVRVFFESSKRLPPVGKSNLSLHEVRPSQLLMSRLVMGLILLISFDTTGIRAILSTFFLHYLEHLSTSG